MPVSDSFNEQTLADVIRSAIGYLAHAERASSDQLGARQFIRKALRHLEAGLDAAGETR